MSFNYEPLLAGYRQAVEAKKGMVNAFIDQYLSQISDFDDDPLIRKSVTVNPDTDRGHNGPYISIDQVVKIAQLQDGNQSVNERKYEILRDRMGDSPLYPFSDDGFEPVEAFISGLYSKRSYVPPIDSSLKVGIFIDEENSKFNFNVQDGNVIWQPFHPSIRQDASMLSQGQKTYEALQSINDPVEAFKVLLDKLVRWQSYHSWPTD